MRNAASSALIRSAQSLRVAASALLVALALALPGGEAGAADAAFDQFLASLRPEAQAAGVSQATFETYTRGLEPDETLPDLVIPGRPSPPSRQAEFVQVPQDYLKEASIARLAKQGRALRQQHRIVLERIEQQFGVPGPILLAIWARESDFGRAAAPYNAVRVLATQAYLGRRKQQFRQEFVLALKILQDGHATLADMRSSWAGALGLAQILPSEFYKNAVDFDGDGRIDIFRSVPDALATAARQLRSKGWQPGLHWAYEVRAPASADCSLGVPEVQQPIRDWMRQGFVPARGRRLSTAEQNQPASLLQPEGRYGPAFLTTQNYFVIKAYNFSDLYVLFVGHLADRIETSQPFETPWAATEQLRTADVETMQRHLTRLGLYQDKIDGRAGMQTRAALGAFQKSAGLTLDCWPTQEVLRALSSR